LNYSTVKENISNGFILMLGDFVTKFFSSIDKWFIKYLMDTFCFAMYSFAVSMENLVNTFMSPVTVSMYNFFCKKPSITKIKQMKDFSTIYSFLVIAGAFPCKWILEHFMKNYISASSVMFLLFAAQGLSAIIKGIYVNKYKAEGTQNRYFRQMVVMLVLSAVLNGLFYFIMRSMVSIAMATLFANIIWIVTCEIQNPDLRYDIKTYICIIIMLTVYIYSGFRMNAIAGCVVYCAVGLACLMLLMRESFLFVLTSISGSLKNRLNLCN
jgi:O-antigen/teichoic acid export membrane protein